MAARSFVALSSGRVLGAAMRRWALPASNARAAQWGVGRNWMTTPVRPSVCCRYYATEDKPIGDGKCWKCGEDVGSEKESWFTCPHCSVVQPPVVDRNLFQLFNIEQRFDIDEKAMSQSYLEFQKRLHPDRFHGKGDREKTYSAQHSSTINDGYELLKDSESRAVYMLRLAGKEVGENDEVNDSAFLMKVFELREDIDDAVAAKDVAALQSQLAAVDGEIANLCSKLETSFRDSDLDAAYSGTVQLIYFKRMRSEILKHMPVE